MKVFYIPVPVTTYQVCVIKIGDRFYSGHTKKRIQTAWSLAGAKLFLVSQAPNQHIVNVGNHLIEKGYKPVCHTVNISE
jgi:hypothetical protein